MKDKKPKAPGHPLCEQCHKRFDCKQGPHDPCPKLKRLKREFQEPDPGIKITPAFLESYEMYLLKEDAAIRGKIGDGIIFQRSQLTPERVEHQWSGYQPTSNERVILSLKAGEDDNQPLFNPAGDDIDPTSPFDRADRKVSDGGHLVRHPSGKKKLGTPWKMIYQGFVARQKESFVEYRRPHLNEEENKILWLADRQNVDFKQIALILKVNEVSLWKKAERAREKEAKGILFYQGKDGRKKRRMYILRKKGETGDSEDITDT